MLAASHASTHGMSELPPQGDDSAQWYKSVKVDLEAFHKYALDVFQAVDDYLASIDDSVLEEKIDMGSFGEQTKGWLCTIILLNNSWHTGEIAAIKGIYGLQGYPF